jgi:hypothetical protein
LCQYLKKGVGHFLIWNNPISRNWNLFDELMIQNYAPIVTRVNGRDLHL